MKVRLVAIWEILTSQYFMLITGNGSLQAICPKDLESITLIKNTCDAIIKKEKGDVDEEKD